MTTSYILLCKMNGKTPCRWCFLPKYKNTTIKTPTKLFSRFRKVKNCENGGFKALLEVKKLKKIRTEGLKKIEHFYLSQPITLHSQKPFFFVLPHLSRVTGNIYLFLSLCVVIFIFFYRLVYPLTEILSLLKVKR